MYNAALNNIFRVLIKKYEVDKISNKAPKLEADI